MVQERQSVKQTRLAKNISRNVKTEVKGPDGKQSLQEFFNENKGQIVGMAIGGKYFPIRK